MNDTPLTDRFTAQIHTGIEWARFARKLELDMQRLEKELAEAKQRSVELFDIAKSAQKECREWKANHDNQVKLKHTLMDRPDLKDRAQSMARLHAEVDRLTLRALGLECLIYTTLACATGDHPDKRPALHNVEEILRNGIRILQSDGPVAAHETKDTPAP